MKSCQESDKEEEEEGETDEEWAVFHHSFTPNLNNSSFKIIF